MKRRPVPLVAASDAGLPGAYVGIVPLLYANDDLPELTTPIESDRLLDELQRLGFAGLQLTRVVPRGPALSHALQSRGLRIAEVYAAMPCDIDGPSDGARRLGLSCVDELAASDGDVLVLSYHLSSGRVENAGRASRAGVPTLSARGFDRAVALLHELSAEAVRRGHTAAYHPHVGTFVETPDEVERLMDETDPDLLRLCLDTGHYTLGGGDPVAAIDRYRERLGHVHLKDVDRGVMNRLVTGEIASFLDALRERVFTELGAGVLDVVGVANALIDIGYSGWIMSEQDTTWRAPSESAAIARSVWSLAVGEASRLRPDRTTP